MWHWGFIRHPGSGTALLAAALALAAGWPLSSFLEPHLLYIAYFLSALVLARLAGESVAFCVLFAGSLAGMMCATHHFREDLCSGVGGMDTLAHYGAGVACILLLDYTARLRRTSRLRPTDPGALGSGSQAGVISIPRNVLFEHTRDGISILDLSGRLREANGRFSEMLGYSREEIQPLSVWDWDVQWTREELLQILSRSDLAGGIFETRHRRRDGGIIEVEISANRVEWGGQSLCYCVSRDISERRKTEQALNRESEERFRLLVEQAADGFFVVDEQGTIVDVNRMACESLGYSRSELLGMRSADVQVDFDQVAADGIHTRVESEGLFWCRPTPCGRTVVSSRQKST